MTTPLKIAVFRALQLGDLLCALPAVAHLKRCFPDSILYMIGLPHMKSLIERYDFIDEFIVFPGYAGLPELPTPDLAEIDRFVQEMQKRDFDLLFQMQGSGTIVNDFLKLWKAKRLIGFCPDRMNANKDWLHYPDDLHEVDRHLALLEHMGLKVKSTDRRLLFPLGVSDWEAFHALGRQVNLERYAIVHVGSRSTDRQWPLSNFKYLAEHLYGQGLQIVLTGTVAEEGLVGEMEQLLDIPVINLTGKTNLGEIGCLVKNATILLCNCTGTSHIAAALETRSIVISLDGEPNRWGPMNKALHSTYDGRQELDLEAVKVVIDRMLQEHKKMPIRLQE